MNELIDKLPWYLKYRPQTLEGGRDETDLGLVVNEKLFNKLQEYKSDQNIPHLLFVGKSGIGKTTLARILATEVLGCEEIEEMNASKDRGIDYIRDRIHTFCTGQSYNGGLKCVIVGEADGLTMQAQDCLNEVIENYADNTRFIFTANNMNKISSAVLSRCTKFDIEYDIKDYIKRCAKILKLENVEIDVAVLKDICKSTFPDFRQALEELKKNSVNGKLMGIQEINTEFYKEMWKMVLQKKEPFQVRSYYIKNYGSYSGDYYTMLGELVKMAITCAQKFWDTDQMTRYNDSLWFIARANRAIRDESLHKDPELNTLQVFIENHNKDFAI